MGLDSHICLLAESSEILLSVFVFCFKGPGGKLVTFADPHKPKIWAREPAF